ncbi:hypothetical protein EVAR_79672_1 [Eumeta japonica]|uniref:Uncharacterized protein n=1 Tax=Eumeta variegata TaxID=151549 RepID=A0A4C1W9V1_EUMVA|nr:hypothetical protein EVAR_79672_1 [Eumeta japonica]
MRPGSKRIRIRIESVNGIEIKKYTGSRIESESEIRIGGELIIMYPKKGNSNKEEVIGGYVLAKEVVVSQWLRPLPSNQAARLAFEVCLREHVKPSVPECWKKNQKRAKIICKLIN